LGMMATGQRWQMADGRWQMADGRWQMADGRWQTWQKTSLGHTSLLILSLIVSLRVHSGFFFFFFSSLLSQQMTQMWQTKRALVTILVDSGFSSFPISSLFSVLSLSLLALFSLLSSLSLSLPSLSLFYYPTNGTNSANMKFFSASLLS